MKIAQVSPLYECVPPKCYGGTERVVSYLTEELINLGHEVTLFASGDSLTRAGLVPCCPKALRLSGRCIDPISHHVAMLEQVYRRAAEFDIIHFHIDCLHFPLTRREPVPTVTTLHGRLDIPDLVPLYEEYSEVPLVSISNSQREPLPWVNWQATVYHGLPLDAFSFHEQTSDYLLFVGRISPEKRPDLAIEIARQAGMELRIAAKVDRADQEYFDEQIKPLLRQSHVTFLGEVGGADKEALLGGAAALLFPIDWPEPFGLVMIEAMACGTPVIAFRRGSVLEIIDDGLTGFICRDVGEAVEAVGRIGRLSRRRCREMFEQRFSVTRMASDYVEVYQRLVETCSGNGRARSVPGPALYPSSLTPSGPGRAGVEVRGDVCRF